MSGWFETIGCGWCGSEIRLPEGALPRDAYAIERGDGDKFYLCSWDHARKWIEEEYCFRLTDGEPDA